ncbi:hypothetical protein B0H14DRAFT_3652136 [Mycena olivaceomarginata]|nr:hypothetical protein B0H14DRAFT_3652136 [Mycena olivaceomarginata]
MDVPTSDFAFPLPPTITLDSNSILMGGGKVTSSSSGDPGKETPTTASLSVVDDPTTYAESTKLNGVPKHYVPPPPRNRLRPDDLPAAAQRVSFGSERRSWRDWYMGVGEQDMRRVATLPGAVSLDVSATRRFEIITHWIQYRVSAAWDKVKYSRPAIGYPALRESPDLDSHRRTLTNSPNTRARSTPTASDSVTNNIKPSLPAKTEAGSTSQAKTEATLTSAAASESTAVNTPIYTLTLPPGMTTVTRLTPSSTAGSAQASGLSSIVSIDMCHMSPAAPTRVIVGVSVAISGIIPVIGLVFFVLCARRRRRNDTGTVSQFMRVGLNRTMARRPRKGLGLERAAPSERQDVDPDLFDGLGGAHLASEADREITTLRIQIVISAELLGEGEAVWVYPLTQKIRKVCVEEQHLHKFQHVIKQHKEVEFFNVAEIRQNGGTRPGLTVNLVINCRTLSTTRTSTSTTHGAGGDGAGNSPVLKPTPDELIDKTVFANIGGGHENGEYQEFSMAALTFLRKLGSEDFLRGEFELGDDGLVKMGESLKQ